MNDFNEYVKRALKGDTEAFSKLYEMVYKDMYHIALYNLRSPHDACDAVSDAVADAFISMKKLKSPEAFRSWIMKILYAKIKRRQKEYYNSGEYEESISGESEFDFESTELKDALSKLDDESRSILSMSVLGGYTSKEIAKMCGMNCATVRSKLSRIKQSLQKALTQTV